jgi:hypothetical protein
MTLQNSNRCEPPVAGESSKTLSLQFHLVANSAWRVMFSNTVIKSQSAHDTMRSQFFYPLLLSWVYENRFASFYQGLSPWGKT